MMVFHEQRKYRKNLPVSVFISKEMNFLAHWHTEVEFIYILEGTQRIGVNQQVHTLEKGDFAICSSGDIHYYSGSDDVPKQIITIFKPSFIGYGAGWPQQLRFTTSILKREMFCHAPAVILAMDKIEGLLLETFEEYTQEKAGYIDYIKSKLLEICTIALRTFPSVPSGCAENSFRQYNLERMQESLEFIEENYTGKITLENLAEHANLSYFHFSRLFKQTVGMNFKEYLNKRRIQQAEILLGQNGMPVTQIAYECGFESVRSFYRAYKDLKGESPIRGRNLQK